MLFVSFVVLDSSIVQSMYFSDIKSYTISQYLYTQYGFWNTYHNLPLVLCCFPFPISKPWLGGICNKRPEVLIAELI